MQDLRGMFNPKNDSTLKIASQIYLSSHSTLKKSIFYKSYAIQMIKVNSRKTLNQRKDIGPTSKDQKLNMYLDLLSCCSMFDLRCAAL